MERRLCTCEENDFEWCLFNSDGHVIEGGFDTFTDAEEWCEENNYEIVEKI